MNLLIEIQYYILFLWKDIQLGWFKFLEERAKSRLALYEDKLERKK